MSAPEPVPAKTPRDAADYDRWLKRKIARGLDQAADRAAMIPADEVWRALDLER